MSYCVLISDDHDLRRFLLCNLLVERNLFPGLADYIKLRDFQGQTKVKGQSLPAWKDSLLLPNKTITKIGDTFNAMKNPNTSARVIFERQTKYYVIKKYFVIFKRSKYFLIPQFSIL